MHPPTAGPRPATTRNPGRAARQSHPLRILRVTPPAARRRRPRAGRRGQPHRRGCTARRRAAQPGGPGRTTPCAGLPHRQSPPALAGRPDGPVRWPGGDATTGGSGPADDAATWEPLLAQVPQPRTGQDWADWLRSTAKLHGENGSVTLPEIWQALTWMARREGFAVEREYCGHGDGVTAWHRRAIRVRPGIGGVPAVTALTHELAHILLHRPVRDVPGASTAGCRGIQHLQAVSVAFVVCSRLGVDTTGCSVPHVASWAGGDPRARPGTAIRHAAAHIIDAAETIGSHLGEMLPALGARPAAAVRDQESALLPPPPPHRQPLPAAPPPPPVPASVHRVLRDALPFYVARRDGSWVPGYLTGRGVAGAAAPRAAIRCP